MIYLGKMVMVGDMLLGYGVHDTGKSGLEGFLSAYLDLPDGRICWSAMLGMIEIPLEGLCYFAIYRLIASGSMHYAQIAAFAKSVQFSPLHIGIDMHLAVL